MERIPFFLFHNLTNQKRSRTNTSALLLHSDQILPVQSGLGILSLLLACIGFEAGWRFLFRFPAWVQFFVSGVTWSARAPSVALVWRLAGLLRCRVTSPGKLSSPLKLLSSLFCGVTALARSWTSLVGFAVRVQRAGFQVSLARVGARSYEFRSTRELQEREERRARALAHRFKLSEFRHRPQAAGPIRASVRGGAPPARLGFCKALSCDEK